MNIFTQSLKPSKVRQIWKILISVFAYDLRVSSKYLFMQGRLATRQCPMQFWDFSNIFLFLKILSLWVIWQLVRQLLYKFYWTKYQVCFCLWWLETVLKLCKGHKYYEQNCLKTSLLLLLSLNMIKIFEDSAISTQIRRIYLKGCHQQKLIASWSQFLT